MPRPDISDRKGEVFANVKQHKHQKKRGARTLPPSSSENTAKEVDISQGNGDGEGED